ncbi:2-deoxy-scyllo-inosamine dehydrogenase [Colletotrichum aenigma]|uniref:2-deoxy-scyllo-inosamine dehydrogenase n=1 Tax=Colletotrichum aenigma TaxID=1215731 RepID=UPI0018733CB3|nr:2-deoxy-scyllo-inosamine dehydrogenase [Colletotrichum aenigma]KAF5507400.1 2-deoxy-scyllo-inosamine dehydrogenase [Colletotrichum aenigma]
MSTATQTKALLLPSVSSPLSLTHTTVPVPSPLPGQTIVSVLASAISPTASSYLTGVLTALSFPTPFIPGHAAIARVLHPSPDSVSLQPGQLVLVDSYVAARDDPDVHILLGLHDGATPQHKKLFRDVWPHGLWKAAASVPVENCHPLDEDRLSALGYSYAELLYLNRLAVAYGGVRAVGLKAGQTLVVAPATGQYSGAAVELASAIGANVIAIGRNPETLRKLSHLPRVKTLTLPPDSASFEETLTSSLRALAPRKGADAYIDLSPPTLADPGRQIRACIAALRDGGRAALMGGVAGDVGISHPSIMFRNITVKGQYMYTREQVGEVIRLVESGVVNLGDAVGHEKPVAFGLADWDTALREASDRGSWGQAVVFVPEQE